MTNPSRLTCQRLVRVGVARRGASEKLGEASGSLPAETTDLTGRTGLLAEFRGAARSRGWCRNQPCKSETL